jgi:Uma2 family endonuclease
MAVTQRKPTGVRTRPGPFTYKHLRHLRERLDDRNRYEIINGVLEVTPSPTMQHQWAGGEFYWVLSGYVRAHDLGMIFFAPLDVILSEIDVVQPGLLYLTHEQIERSVEEDIEEPPTLAIEILSPSTAPRDRGRKRELYERAGVPHYWLVDPVRRTLEVYELREGRYELLLMAAGDDEFRPALFPGLVIRLGTIWPPRAGRRKR